MTHTIFRLKLTCYFQRKLFSDFYVFFSLQSWKQYRESRFKKTVAEITMNILIHQIIQKQEAIKGGLI